MNEDMGLRMLPQFYVVNDKDIYFEWRETILTEIKQIVCRKKAKDNMISLAKNCPFVGARIVDIN